MEDNFPDTVILHFGINNLKNNENAEEIVTDIMNLAVSVKKQKKTVVVSGITFRNDKFNDKGKNINSLPKRKCKEERIVFVDNGNITLE